MAVIPISFDQTHKVKPRVGAWRASVPCIGTDSRDDNRSLGIAHAWELSADGLHLRDRRRPAEPVLLQSEGNHEGIAIGADAYLHWRPPSSDVDLRMFSLIQLSRSATLYTTRELSFTNRGPAPVTRIFVRVEVESPKYFEAPDVFITGLLLWPCDGMSRASFAFGGMRIDLAKLRPNKTLSINIRW
ncbi:MULTISPECIES: hypothetical protein [unclassified Chelatococcus]|uniref:hypothetical protein n=1 Tax=unclassified Chelatococcus TaxID=2638111 RepID=UPI001BCCB1E5|nr:MULTISPECIES: hypothetical protein [unclassified Chelatococcus]CAH1672301.1 hypothetical protein CHELA20_50902 [Hyphomicrobiales bacterium]MBS7738964.1 hypothetical protein [Chelatococcus sp. HY11]MBX3543397.1 hypothetical protein [Chelatococcus sp.]MCO5076506.1 hypothetical protein [Chelatococcus sp.]CAH1675464.1 hypothetical protein CHELA41_24110 [Hyphomicrobiales bacterium]